jgi:hypothetical protein
MNVLRSLRLGVLLTALVVTGAMARAQEQGQQVPIMGQGMHGPMGQQTDQSMMGGCPMMGLGKQDIMGQGTMRPGLMQGSMGPGSMHGGTGPGMMQSGMGALFGSLVTPMMNLSAEDVRGYLGAQLVRLDNKRLKVGDIKADDGAITADIVTVDNSLVQRLKVDRHTGTIEYQN